MSLLLCLYVNKVFPLCLSDVVLIQSLPLYFFYLDNIPCSSVHFHFSNFSPNFQAFGVLGICHACFFVIFMKEKDSDLCLCRLVPIVWNSQGDLRLMPRLLKGNLDVLGSSLYVVVVFNCVPNRTPNVKGVIKKSLSLMHLLILGNIKLIWKKV